MNEKFFDDLEAKIDAIDTCELLDEIREEIMNMLLEMKAAIEKQLEDLEPLMTPPTTPPGVIIWIVNFIKFIKQMYDTYVGQLQMIITRIIRIQQKLADKAKNLGCSEKPAL